MVKRFLISNASGATTRKYCNLINKHSFIIFSLILLLTLINISCKKSIPRFSTNFGKARFYDQSRSLNNTKRVSVEKISSSGFIRLLDDAKNVNFIYDPLKIGASTDLYLQGSWESLTSDGSTTGDEKRIIHCDSSKVVAPLANEAAAPQAKDQLIFHKPSLIDIEKGWNFKTKIKYSQNSSGKATYGGLIFCYQEHQRHLLVLEMNSTKTQENSGGNSAANDSLNLLYLIEENNELKQIWRYSFQSGKDTWLTIGVSGEEKEKAIFSFFLQDNEIHKIELDPKEKILNYLGMFHAGEESFFSDSILYGKGGDTAGNMERILKIIDLAGLKTAPLEEINTGIAYQELTKNVIDSNKNLDWLYRRAPFQEDPHYLKAAIQKHTYNCFLAPAGTVFDWSVKIPPDAYLEVALGILEDSLKYFDQEVVFKIEAIFENGHSQILLNKSRQSLVNEKDNQGWLLQWVDLKDLEGKNIKLRFSTLVYENSVSKFACGATAPFVLSAWGDPTLVWGDNRLSNENNLILISLDTLRADHLGCYGYDKRETSSFIDKLALEGIQFAQTVSQANWTTPSHLSIMTSLYPLDHSGAFNLWSRMNTSCTTLADTLQPNFTTAAFTGSASIAASYGFSQGFSSYREPPGVLDQSHDHIYTLRKASEWLEQNYKRRFFLFLHSYEPHDPYDSTFFSSQIPESASLESQTIAKYDGDIKSSDQWVGSFVHLLKELGIYEKSVIILTSDHGEHFFEKTPQGILFEHRCSMYDELLLVPLIIRYPNMPAVLPPSAYKGSLINTQVRSIDLAPTALELLNQQAQPAFVGKSLMSFVQTPNAEGLPAFSQSDIRDLVILICIQDDTNNPIKSSYACDSFFIIFQSYQSFHK